MKQEQLIVWVSGGLFNPVKVDLYGEERKVMTERFLECLKHTCNSSSSNLIRNADDLLCRRKENLPVDWIGENKVRVPPQKFKFPY